ncbi:hypothetical protein V1478_010088 [Vespula squamosa]|uniref:Uncharacterized protein n=1 Tax=Vespula squamosa TaxID=30214 RepID=A0ABD2AIQ8_VESSQ
MSCFQVVSSLILRSFCTTPREASRQLVGREIEIRDSIYSVCMVNPLLYWKELNKVYKEAKTPHVHPSSGMMGINFPEDDGMER